MCVTSVYILYNYVHDTRKKFLSCSPAKRLLATIMVSETGGWLPIHTILQCPQFFHCHSPTAFALLEILHSASGCTGENIRFPQGCMDFSASILLGKASFFFQAWERRGRRWGDKARRGRRKRGKKGGKWNENNKAGREGKGRGKEGESQKRRRRWGKGK